MRKIAIALVLVIGLAITIAAIYRSTSKQKVVDLPEVDAVVNEYLIEGQEIILGATRNFPLDEEEPTGYLLMLTDDSCFLASPKKSPLRNIPVVLEVEHLQYLYQLIEEEGYRLNCEKVKAITNF